MFASKLRPLIKNFRSESEACHAALEINTVNTVNTTIYNDGNVWVK